ncbi:AraC family transcriptional regulator [Luteimonas sp. FCS-9]|uniref:helix-turn-helix domain-containing protein n=1 Tax=Luteimonas sp. FCS-9 TaxID=1547516 RepID=UPI00063EB297|nr:AraC family transcriptional regulator [Luteimonas sp. FCS-9]KLJ00147.1 AraC family transcriptional regulator [Luteimonas sp. FCS-9]
MVDRLAVLLDRFRVTADVDAAAAGADADTAGTLWLVASGTLLAYGDAMSALPAMCGPGLLLVPQPLPGSRVEHATGARAFAARLRFEGGADNPLVRALPAALWLPAGDVPGAAGLFALLFEEAFDARCGRAVLLDRLVEALLVQVLRERMESGALRGGLLAGMAHPRLRRALVALHEAPARDWSLASLAQVAGMSRSAFAQAFREALGQTPGHYLQGWRIALAQRALRRGRPLKRIAEEVGYGSEAALSRAFKAQAGLSPRAWRQAAGLRGAAA